MPAQNTGTLTTTGSVTLTKPASDTLTQIQLSGTYGTVTGVIEGSMDGTVFVPLAAVLKSTGAVATGTLSPADNSSVVYDVPSAGLTAVRFRATAVGSGTLAVAANSAAYVGLPPLGSYTNGGTFSGVTLSGTTTITGDLKIPSATVAAAGNAQGNAAAITTGFTLVSAADATKGVVLPAAAAGLVCIVKNIDAANAILKVYPASGDAINALSADAALSMAAKTSAVFVAYDATTWYTTPLLPS